MAQATTRKTATPATKARRTRTTKPKGLTIERLFTTPGVHPYDTVEWELRDVEQKNWQTGEVIFEQTGVEFPSTWSVNASTIATTKYFRGALRTPDRERSLKQLIDRVADTYTREGGSKGYFATPEDEEIFNHELKYALLHQYFAFNSPVWFNVGTTSVPQVSACFILNVQDSMESILNWYREEGMIFKGGSGAGVNLSNLRSSKELLSSGGTASGPVSFMRGADASAGTIKSGGATRRAAKMVVLDIDHPDIEEFIETKAREEDKIRALKAAGFDMEISGKDINSVQYQNANNSVRVDDLFMEAVRDGKNYGLVKRSALDERGQIREGLTDEEAFTEVVDARTLFRSVAQAAWECADPGIQYKDTINDWHTLPAHSPITASNPCSEFMSIDNSSCNLASVNLMKFLNEDGTFDVERFEKLVMFTITAMDISVAFGHFPTEAIGENTRKYRQLGIGYANLGALLMATGHAYDSDSGRALAASITSLMSAAAHVQSARLAQVVGPYHDWKLHKPAHQRVVDKHREAASRINDTGHDDDRISDRAYDLWTTASSMTSKVGLRNSQLSLLAPTGTIGFLMDCDTTGIEPDFSLVKFKKLVGGGSMQIVNGTVFLALERLGYSSEDASAITAYIKEHGHVVDAPGLKSEHYAVFDCAVGDRSISAMGHIEMMAAVQPFLSGAISKTVNLPQDATVEDIENVYYRGWELGLKAIAVYRDSCKAFQPLSGSSSSKKTEDAVAKPAAQTVVIQTVEKEKIVYRPKRERLPRKRDASTTSFNVGGAEGYLTAGTYDDGRLGELFLKFGKQGSTLAGVMDSFSIAVSVALQYGVPLETFVAKFVNQKFEPAGMTDDPDLRMATSLMDYVFRRLALDHMPFEERSEFSIYTAEERARHVETGSYELTEEEQSLLDQDDLTSIRIGNGGNDSDDTPSDEIPAVKVSTTSVALSAPEPAPAPAEVHSSAELAEKLSGRSSDAPLCMTCGTKMQRAGSCYVCEGCGNTSGCS